MADRDRSTPAPDRDARLAEALRANLRRRKHQARGRRAGEPRHETAASPDEEPSTESKD